MAIITSAVADYGTRKLITTAAVQENLYSYSAAMGFSEVDTTTVGVYRSPFTNIANAVNEEVTGNTYTAVDASTDADILPIDRRAIFSETVGAFDEVSFASGSLIADRAMNAAKVMSQSIDRHVINKAVTQAPTMLVDAGAVSTGTPFSATPWTVSALNALSIVNAVIEEVNFNEGYGDDKFILVDTSFVKFLTGYFQASGNNVADETIRGGVPYVGMLAGGVKVFQSNNVPHYASITFGAQVTAGDFIVINGVTWTFRAVPALPGEVDIGADAAGTQANFLSALQNPATTSGLHIALSLDNQNKIKNLAITAASVSTAVQISTKGAFRLTASFTSGSNTVSTVRKRLLAGSMRAVKVFVPTKGMKYQEKDAIGGLDGTEILMRQFFNSMTETRKAPLTVTVLTV
jgi:hypothetical protein